MYKNKYPQHGGGQVFKTDGSPYTGTGTARLALDGALGAGIGVLTHLGTGYFDYIFGTSETNHNHVSLIIDQLGTAFSVIPSCVQYEPRDKAFYQPGGYNNILEVGSGKSYSTIALALADAVKGDLIEVHSGTYTPAAGDNLLKDGVDQYYHPDAVVTRTANITATRWLFSDGGSAVRCKVMGYGKFTDAAGTTNGSLMGGILTSHANSVILFECDSFTLTDPSIDTATTSIGKCTAGYQEIKVRIATVNWEDEFICSGGRQVVTADTIINSGNTALRCSGGEQTVKAGKVQANIDTLFCNGGIQVVVADEIVGSNDMLSCSSGVQIIHAKYLNGSAIWNGGGVQLVKFDYQNVGSDYAIESGGGSGKVLVWGGYSNGDINYLTGPNTSIELFSGEFGGVSITSPNTTTIHTCGPVYFRSTPSTGVTVDHRTPSLGVDDVAGNVKGKVLGSGSTSLVGTGVITQNIDTIISSLSLLDTATILSRLGGWAGTGVNTILGALRAIANKAAGITVPTDLGSGYDNTTDSLEAIRDRGDLSWVTGSQFSGTFPANFDKLLINTTGQVDTYKINGQLQSAVDLGSLMIAIAVKLLNLDSMATMMEAVGTSYYRWKQTALELSPTGSAGTSGFTSDDRTILYSLLTKAYYDSVNGSGQDLGTILTQILADVGVTLVQMQKLNNLEMLGDFAGTGTSAETVKGFLRAIAGKLVTLPSGLTGTSGYDNTTDSLQAIKDSGVGGGAGTALTAQQVRDALLLSPTGTAVVQNNSIDKKLLDIQTSINTGSGQLIDPTFVGPQRKFRFEAIDQMTAVNVIREVISSDSFMIAMDVSENVLPAGESVASATLDSIWALQSDGSYAVETGTGTGLDIATPIQLDAEKQEARMLTTVWAKGEYLIVVKFFTPDSQSFTRRGKFVAENKVGT